MPPDPIPDPIYDAVLESYHRCEDSGAFIENFYDIFFCKSPEIAPKFANTDMEKQQQILGASLLWMLRLGRGDPIAISEVRKIGESHSRKGHDIPPHLYNLWLDALCEAVEEHDPELSTELEAHWRIVMEKGIDLIISMY